MSESREQRVPRGVSLGRVAGRITKSTSLGHESLGHVTGAFPVLEVSCISGPKACSLLFVASNVCL